jgi:subtilisin family serine protease
MNPSLPLEFLSNSPAPSSIHGYISVRGSVSVFSDSVAELATSSAAFHAPAEVRDLVAQDLQQLGFTIIAASKLGFAVAGSPSAYEQLSGGKVETKERLMLAESGETRYVTHIDIVGDHQPTELGVAYAKSTLPNIDGILIERPKVCHGVSPSPLPPSSSRFHLNVPNDVALGLNALQAHRAGFRGEGVTVAMPDTGQYQHPFFIAQGYNVKPTITVVPNTDPSKDPIGHGTGESANIFAIAPGAVLQGIRASDNGGNLVGAMSGFLKAKELNPQIITCSWGGNGPYPPRNQPDRFDRAMALEIQDTIEQGIVVIFSGGNGQFSIEPQVPGVIAAGGTHMAQDLTLQASNYASGYDSPWFPGVRVPTVCGLVGLLPRAQYIMLPVPPGCEIDIDESKVTADDSITDGTTESDGWALFSGTSAAAPQLAGAVALILGAKPGITPAQVIEALTKTATDISMGRCSPRFNHLATIGPDNATGFGLVNAFASVQYAIANF